MNLWMLIINTSNLTLHCTAFHLQQIFFPIQMIISLNEARYLPIRLVKQSPQPKIMRMDLFQKKDK